MADCSAFAGHELIARGPLPEVALAAKAAWDDGRARLLIFDDETGRQIEIDFRGDSAEVAAKLASPPPQRGRPRLGVTSREVTLLPSHWEWLAEQPGGASATLRRLVDAARRGEAGRRREAQEAAHRVLFALAGDLPAFEEANRAFYASECDRLEDLTSSWPPDVRSYVLDMIGRVRAFDLDQVR